MNPLIGYVITGVVMLVVGLLLREFEPKVKIVYWVPHTFWFNIPIPQPENPSPTGGTPATAALLSHAITIQNAGRKTAENVEIVLRAKPDFFKLQPPMDYVESKTPAGEHVITVKSLGHREFLTVEFLSYASHPDPLLIRSSAGPGQLIPVQTFRLFNPWLNRISSVLILTGFGFWMYWLLRVAVFILRGINIIQ